MKITVIVDMQKDFIDGVLGSREAQKIVPAVAKEIRRCRSDAIIITRDTHEGDYHTIEGERLPEHCLRGSEGWLEPEEIASAIREKDIPCRTVTKHSFSGGSNLLGAVLEAASSHKNPVIEEITIFGLCTDICVISNALMLRSEFPSTLITVRSDLCAGSTPGKHNAALEVLKSCLIDIRYQADKLSMHPALRALGFIECENNVWGRGHERVMLLDNMMSYSSGKEDGKFEGTWGYEYIFVKNNEIYNNIANVDQKFIAMEA